MYVKPQSQIKLRLDDRVIHELKIQADLLNISTSSLINQLLDHQLFGDNSTPIGFTTVCVKIDNLLSSVRSIDRKLVQQSIQRR